MSELARKNCVPCRRGTPALHGEEVNALARKIPGWQVVDEHHLLKAYKFPDFASALDFVNTIGVLAEQQGHHPDLELSWGRVGVKIFTHVIQGLSESDFILAAKIDELLPRASPDPRD